MSRFRHGLFVFLPVLVLIWVVLIPWTAASGTALPPLAPDSSAERISVRRSVHYLFETRPLSPHELLAPEMDGQWTVHPDRIVNFNTRTDHLWLRFDLRNDQAVSRTWLLEISWPLLDVVELITLDQASGTWSRVLRAGNLAAESPGVSHFRHPVLPVSCGPDSTVTVLLRVNSSLRLLVPMTLWQPQAFERHAARQGLVYGLLFGTLLAMACYNLSLFAFTRVPSFALYSIYVLSIIPYMLCISGYGRLYLWPDFPWLALHGYGIFSTLSFVSVVFFVRHFLSLREYGSWLLDSSTALAVFWGLMLVWYVADVNPLLVILEDIGAMLSCVIALCITYYLWYRGNVSARYFSIAWTLLIMATAVFVLGMTGVIEYTEITQYAQMIGFVVEVLLLSLAVAERINRERTDRLAAQAMTISLTETAREAQRRELAAKNRLLDMERRATRELEEQVRERTSALEKALAALRTANKDLSLLSITDPLTSVANRRYFERMLHSEFQRAMRAGQPLSLLLVDIDHFKRVNDTYGHPAGDECLRIVAGMLQSRVERAADLVARYGGEEFAVILPHTAEEDAVQVAEGMRLDVAARVFSWETERFSLQLSIGVAGWVPTAGLLPEDFVQAADQALYRAKQRGRNQVVRAVDGPALIVPVVERKQ